MIWERIEALARAVSETDEGTIHMTLQRAPKKDGWAMYVHLKTEGDEISLAWAAKDTIENTAAAVEYQLTVEAKKLLEKTQAATHRLESVLLTTDGDPR